MFPARAQIQTLIQRWEQKSWGHQASLKWIIELLHQPIVKCSISLLWEQMQPAHTCTETVTSHIFFSRDGFYYYAITSKRNHVRNFDSTCFLKWYWMIHDKIRRGLDKLTSLPTKPWSHILGGEHCTSMNRGHGFELHLKPYLPWWSIILHFQKRKYLMDILAYWCCLRFVISSFPKWENLLHKGLLGISTWVD